MNEFVYAAFSPLTYGSPPTADKEPKKAKNLLENMIFQNFNGNLRLKQATFYYEKLLFTLLGQSLVIFQRKFLVGGGGKITKHLDFEGHLILEVGGYRKPRGV